MTYRLTYDPESGAGYIRLREGEYARTIHPTGPAGEGFGVDVDGEGNVLGVEFLSLEEYAGAISRAGGRLDIPERVNADELRDGGFPKAVRGR